jgi:hypothetical protein
MTGQNLFIITSVLVPIDRPLTYSETRSLYTPHERFFQTLETIRSIRSKAPNNYIYFLEGSNAPIEMENALIRLVDKYINCSQDEEIKLNVEDSQKSKGEVALLLYGLNHLDNLDDFENIFKISGRYYLNDRFDFNKLDHHFNNFRLCGDWYATTLYKIHRSHLKKYREALVSSLQYIDLGIEVALCRVYPPSDPDNQILGELGVSGMVAVWENYQLND